MGRKARGKEKVEENSMVFFTSCSSHFPRAVGRISATFSLIKKFPLVPVQVPPPFSSSFSSLQGADHHPAPSQTGFSLLKSITAGQRDESEEWREGVEKEVAERGNKWGITSGSEVAELISKTRTE